ncbi:MAG TPA: molybdenum cofactor biosynthesis protein MoaE [Nitrospinota bacterium]|jgi:molybdopterin synthase catalytic subunit|nr:molybdenum cofactor biosynthesis protein MoaE [Nitrospinota bacterium]|tara:strand:- start:250 stop:666 length:417 start_codon:yes stop_codon:yes gene_type:complete
MIKIQEGDFLVDSEVRNLRSKFNNTGGVVTFIGTARESSKGKEIKELFFESYEEMAIKKLEALREEAIKKFDIFDLSVIHRLGEIQIADDIVLIIAIAEHRKAAFEACEWAIDELKRTVPIWKKEITTDGDVWVEDHP